MTTIKLRTRYVTATTNKTAIRNGTAAAQAQTTYCSLPNVQADGLKIEILALSENPTPVCCLCNVRITVKRSDEFERKVKQLLSLGVLNAYPRGKGGGIMVNEMQIDDAHADNCRKQLDILSVLLRDLGAPPLAAAEQASRDTVPPMCAVRQSWRPAACWWTTISVPRMTATIPWRSSAPSMPPRNISPGTVFLPRALTTYHTINIAARAN